MFNEFIEAEFEGHKFKIPKEYDAILRLNYGDYMKLPSVEQRHTHQIEKLDFGNYTF